MSTRENRFYFATGTSHASPNYADLPNLEQDLQQLKSALADLGYREAVPGFPLSPDRHQLTTALEAWFTDASREPDDEIVLYYCGHSTSDDRHYLVMKDGLYPTEDLFRSVARTPIAKSVLIVLDTCYSGQMTLDLSRILAPFERRLEQQGCCITVVLALAAGSQS